MRDLHIACDGASHNNHRKDIPREASVGVICLKPLIKRSVFLGNCTNQQAEIASAIHALSFINYKDIEGCNIHIYMDSAYVINTMTKGWKKKANQDLWEILDDIVRTVSLKNKINWYHTTEFGIKSHDLDDTKIYQRKKYHIGARLNKIADKLTQRVLR